MPTPQDIQPLLDFDSPPLLTVYLDVDPTKPENLGAPRAYQTWLKNALRDLEGKIDEADKPVFQEVAARTRHYVDTSLADGKGIVIFAGSNFWQAHHLPVPLTNRAAWGRPEVGPLLCQIYTYRPYGVVLVDHVRSRFFLVSPDDAHEVMDLILPLDTGDWRRMGVVPPSDPGGTMTSGIAGSNLDAFQARIDAHVRRFLTRVADWVPNLMDVHGADGLVLGGPEEPVAELQGLLSPDIAAAVLTTLPIPVESSAAEIRELTVPVVMERREARDVEIVSNLLDRALGNGPAVLGLELTLRYLQAGEVQQVVTARNCEATLCHCPRCDFTTSSLQRTECPVCGIAMEETTLAAMLPALAMTRGSEIIIVGGRAAEHLAPYEGIGALLRF